MSSESSARRRARPRRILFLLGFVAVCAISLAAFGILDRARGKQEVKAWTDEQAIPTVRLVQAEPGPPEQSLLLPGNVSAFNSSSLFARASGYVTAWHSDIGAHLKKGDVLVTISAPDLDQQLEEAKAQLVQLQAAVEQAQANADLGQVTNGRTARLVAQGWSTLEQGDTDRLTAASRNAALAVAKANVRAQQAVVNRLQELSGFEQIKAPFDGVVTARNVNIGDLLNAGGTSGRALYQVADIHRMRIFVNVPQAFLGDLKPGVKATLHLPGQQETFEAELTSTSNALEETSRTALIELQADNPDGKLWPGAFTEVQFHIPSDPGTLRIPSTALIFGTNGMRVAAVDANNKVVLKPVRLGRDLGNRVEIQSGLSLTDRLIDNPQESIEAGAIVRIAGSDVKRPKLAAAE
ncbi:efflux RND transporter periplasmic adaptor subunit [Bradyrhizobium erythrophlei]|uniref:RND family efflux transporter, MFP subunit n=1 Tax=Bradyrhizobium erythrophlei TaxID=1437360 RepID=A0A1M5M026_9BRAD|nr:efflux RND transporter periplasmic adaptor subunit [Bradyrhizobium erythrophlei]SHG70657.1 RND family efflux transporter, MFP subunit [Bradyrhizobium erythrophlei]